MSSQTKKILVTDDSKVVIHALEAALREHGYEVLTAMDGEQCLQQVREHEPDLIFLDLMLPKIHGIDILKTLRHDEKTQHIGVVVSTGRALIQDYQAAIQSGANYYLLKPFEKHTIQQVAASFYDGTLVPEHFPAATRAQAHHETTYLPKVRPRTTYCRIWGSRGSIPVSGQEFHRFGGNTPCLEVRSGSHVIIIDAGTGIRRLGESLLHGDVKEFHLFVGHTHWDHIMGFPFFAPAYAKGVKINIYGAKGFRKSIRELFTGMLDHDYFPVRLDEMQAQLVFKELQDGHPVQIGDLNLHYHYACHPGATLCFKIEHRNRVIGYCSDNEVLVGYHDHPNKITSSHPLLDPHRSLINFYKDVDCLIHEAQYFPDEYLHKVGWGHSSIPNATVMVGYAEPREWIVTHHDPLHTDEIMIRKQELHRHILHDCGIPTTVRMAYEGMEIPF